MKHNFEVYHNRHLVFFSEEHWLHPLFAFEIFLKNSGLDPGSLEVRDKIIGKAAALLMVHLGIKKVYADTLSGLAVPIFESRNVTYSCNLRVDRIDCQTENLLLDRNDPEEAYDLIKKRIELRKTLNL